MTEMLWGALALLVAVCLLQLAAPAIMPWLDSKRAEMHARRLEHPPLQVPACWMPAAYEEAHGACGCRSGGDHRMIKTYASPRLWPMLRALATGDRPRYRHERVDGHDA